MDRLPEAKSARLLAIYARLISGDALNRTALAEEYGVTVRSVQRDIEALRCFLAEQRLRCATRLLECTNLKLSGIAELAGFSDAGHLCRNFRRQHGITPDAYRKMRRNTAEIPPAASGEK